MVETGKGPRKESQDKSCVFRLQFTIGAPASTTVTQRSQVSQVFRFTRQQSILFSSTSLPARLAALAKNNILVQSVLVLHMTSAKIRLFCNDTNNNNNNNNNNNDHGRGGTNVEPQEVHVQWFMREEECMWVITRGWYWMRRPVYQASRTWSSTSSWACFRVFCRRINWSWSAQPRSTSDGCQSFGQVLCPTTIVWPLQTSLPCQCLVILCRRNSGR